MLLRSFSMAISASSWPQGVGYSPVMQAWQRFAGVEADRPGDRFHRQIAERIGPQPRGHAGLDLRRERAALQELRREQLADRRHVDAVEAGRDDRRAGHADVNLLRLAQLRGSAATGPSASSRGRSSPRPAAPACLRAPRGAACTWFRPCACGRRCPR